jgi:hypothetical protein
VPSELRLKCLKTSVKAAIYITNRTPTKQLGWLTPLEKLNKDLGRPNPRPSIAHLRIIGCRAYTKINNNPKKSKMAPGALIGYLVGYDSTNIFRVWIPQERKVIRSRDVIFDEDKRYDPNQPYLEELLHVSVPGKRVILDIPDFRTRNEAIPFGVDELEDDYFDDDDDTPIYSLMRIPVSRNLLNLLLFVNYLPLLPVPVKPPESQNPLMILIRIRPMNRTTTRITDQRRR